MAASLHIKVFGAPSITLDGQPVVGFISAKAMAVIYFLAATQRPQARAVLATLLWTNSSDVYAKKNLRNVLSNLRDVLGPFLDITRDTVQLKLSPLDSVDAARFATRLYQAEQRSVPAGTRQALLEEASALYHGALLDGFQVADAEAFDEWMRAERQRFHLLAVQALNTLVAHCAHNGELLAGINYAGRLLALDPLREETHRWLMLMLALDGQTSAALAQYRSCRQILEQELGVEPSVETRQLFERIGAGELTNTSSRSAAPPSPPPAHNLPVQLTEFLGRAHELQQIVGQLQEPGCRLLTIAGLGGIGKTRLALAAAQAIVDSLDAARPLFPDGVYFVPLAGVEPIEHVEQLVATTIADVVQLPLSGAAPATQLIQALHDKAMLSVLDNFEHLTAATPFVGALLQGTRSIKLVVTSRTRLNTRGEYLVNLDGLALPPIETQAHAAEELTAYDAAHLFIRRARAIAPQVALNGPAGRAVVEICHLLRGLPLGIELAASWVRLLPCDEIVREIRRNLDFLDNTLADAPVQQRSLRAVFNHSWRLLSAPEQDCLRRLARFHGGFTRSAATAVTGATLPLLAALLDRSLIRRYATPPDLGALQAADADARYELPETIRQYAAEQLAQAGEHDLIATRHATYYADWLANHRPYLDGVHQQDMLRAIGAEIENIRIAWQWNYLQLATDENGVARIARSLDSLFHFYDMRSWFGEGAAMFAATVDALALCAPDTQPDPTYRLVYAKAQARQGWFAFHLGRFAESRALLEESLARLRRLDAEAEAIFNLNYLGALLRHLGEFEPAQRSVHEALALAERHADQQGASIALNLLGQLALLAGDYPQAQAFCRRALQIKRATGDRWGMTYSLTYLGRVAQAIGDYAAAQSRFHESLAICRQIGDQRGVAFALQNLADTALLSGHRAEARQHYQESLAISRAIGSHAESSLSLARMGEVACAEGAYGQAAAYLQEALHVAWSVQSTPGVLAAVLGMALLDIATGKPGQALPALALVSNHPASSQAQKQQAARSMAQLGADATSDRAADMTLDEYVGLRMEHG